MRKYDGKGSGYVMKISFSPPDISELEIQMVTDVLRSGWITTGPKTKEFERKIAQYCGTNYAACLNSQTAAAELTLRVLGIGSGDEVITSAYTYTASASIINHVGAIPVLCDTAPGSYEMNYDELENLITNKTKAIIPVDFAGVICDYARIFDIVESKRGLFYPSNKLQEALGRAFVVGDCAHSFGSVHDGKKSGEIADFSCFSFHAVKNLTTAEGGAVTWREIDGVDSAEIYRQYMLLSLHGQSKDALSKSQIGSWEYDIEGLYYKCNMTDILAALGLAQLERYPQLLGRRMELVSFYDKTLKSDAIDFLSHKGNNLCGNGHLYPIRLLGKDEQYRNKVIHYLAEAGISTNVHYKPLPMYSAYQALGFCIEDFPNALAQYCNEITLPLHTSLTDNDVQYICETLRTTLKG